MTVLQSSSYAAKACNSKGHVSLIYPAFNFITFLNMNINELTIRPKFQFE